MASKTAEAARKMAKSEKYLYGKSKITKDRGMLREIWKIRTPEWKWFWEIRRKWRVP